MPKTNDNRAMDQVTQAMEEERALASEAGVCFCDECGKEISIEDATERGPMDLICPCCAEMLEYDDNDGMLES